MACRLSKDRLKSLPGKLQRRKRMKKRILVIASIAVLVVAATIFALAQGHPGQGEKMRGGPEAMLEHISLELSLTDAQKEKANARMEPGGASARRRAGKIDEMQDQIQ